MARYALSPEFSGDAEAVRAAWFGDDQEAEIDRATYEIFLAHAITGHRTARGDTILERFLRTRRKELGERALQFVETLTRGRWGAFEAVEVRPGRGVTLVDLLTGQRYDVRDVSISRVLQRWQLVFGRIVPGRGAWVGDGGVAVLAPHSREEFVRALAEMGAREGDPAAVEVVARAAPKVFRAINEINDRRRIRRAVTIEGDPVAFAGVRYTVRDIRPLVESLEAREDIYPAGLDEHGRLVFNLGIPEERLERKEPGPGPPAVILSSYLVEHPDLEEAGGSGKIVRVAMIQVDQGVVEIQSLSTERIARARAVVERTGADLRLTKQWKTPLDMEHPERAAAELATETEPPRVGTRDPELDRVGEVTRRRIAREFLEEWPRTPLKALGGLTPKDAARDPAARATLVGLVKDIECKAGMSAPVTADDVAELVGILGLGDEIPPPGGAGRASRPEVLESRQAKHRRSRS